MVVKRDWDTEIAVAEKQVRDLETQLDDLTHDPEFVEKLNAATTRVNFAREEERAVGKKLDERAKQVRIEKQTITADGYRNPALAESLLKEAGVTEQEVRGMGGSHCSAPFNIYTNSNWTAISNVIRKMEERFIDADPETKRLREIQKEKMETSRKVGDEQWDIEEPMRELQNQLRRAQREARELREAKDYRERRREERRAERGAGDENSDAARRVRGKKILTAIFTGERPFDWPPLPGAKPGNHDTGE